MIKVSKTYSIVTDESAKDGDIADSGYVYEDNPMTFRELVEELETYYETSCYPLNEHCWASTYPETDFRTGEETSYSLHFVDDEKKRKYWHKALKIAFKKS